jgi:outer membrane protein TolC
MKRIIAVIGMMICCGALLLAADRPAWADDKAVAKEVTLNFADIAARVAGYNNNVRICKLSLSEAQSALSQAQSANRDRRDQRSNINEAIGETKDMINSGTLGETDLKEAQSMLSSLEQLASSLKSQNTSQLERTIEAVTLQNAQSLGQLVNGTQQLFIRIRQLQNNIALKQSKLEQAQLAASKAKTKLAHGLGTQVALNEAQLQVSYARSELSAMEHQLQAMLAQLSVYAGYKQGEILLLGEEPALDLELLAAIDPKSGAEKAAGNNFALKLLKIDRVNANSTSAKKKIDIQIEQQEATVRQNITQKYDLLLETQAKLDLATAELRQAKQQLKTAETNFKLGKIAQSALDKQQANVADKQTAWQNAALTLVMEMGDYQAKLDGLN